MTAEEWRPAKTREELLARFPAMNYERPMDPRANTQVQAMVRAEQIVKRVWKNLALADVLLTAVPAMCRRADAAAAEFHHLAAADARARAQGCAPVLCYETADTEYDPNATYEQGALRIWPVGTNYVDIVRDRWHDAPDRRLTTTHYAAVRLALEVDRHNYCDCCDCNVQLAEGCGGATRLLAVDRATLLLAFRCCWACEAALIGELPAHHPGTPIGPQRGAEHRAQDGL